MDRLVGAVSAGRGSALVIRGEAGIGKTALLEYVQAAPGLSVVRAAGVEFETKLAFAGLHQLCAPALNRLPHLPASQGEALKAAFGLSCGAGTPDLFRVGVAVLRLLSEAAARQPLLCVFDDAQWLDQSSAQALAFVARRVQAEPVGFVFAVREPSDRRELATLPTLRLGGMAEDDARDLLASRIRALAPGPVRERIIAEARGNPLALLELSRIAWRTGGFALFDATPLPGKAAAGYRARLQALPTATRLLLLTAAAEPTGDPALLRRAAAKLGIGVEAAAAAQDAALISLGAWVRFRHPLMRSMVYRSASLDDRRAVHEALAAVMDDKADPDSLAWHRSQAAAGPDEEVAGALHRSADRARERGGVAAAAAFLEQAVTLTPDPALRAARALTAARCKRDMGATGAALDLLAVAEAGPLDDLRQAGAATLRARIAFDTKRNDASALKLLRAAQLMAPLDPSSARETFLEALAAAVFTGRFADGPRVLDTASAAREVLGDPQSARPLDLLLDGLTTQMKEGDAAAVPLLRQAVDTYCREEGRHDYAAGELWMACWAAMDLWDDEAWRALTDRQMALSRRAGALATLPVSLSHRALAHIHDGEFADAAALAQEAHVLAAEVGSPPVFSVDVVLAAWRGDQTRASEVAELALGDAAERGEGRLVTAVEYARTVLYNGLGRYESAVKACRPACDLDEVGFHSWIPVEFLEAAARTGRRELAAPVLERLTERTRASATDWAAGMELRSRALFTDGPAADELYREAIDRLGRGSGTPHLARARLLYGEWLRRQGRRTEARAQLHTAHEALSSIGADAFAERAARELAATGQRARKRKAGAVAQLTVQECQVARLVATGATSKEVGSQLFLSPRTIDAHLRNIFRKLGISSRRELRDLPLAR